MSGKISDGFYQFDNDLNSVIDAAAGNGVVSGLAVTQKGAGADMSVDVAVGSYVANGVLVIKSSVTNVVIIAAHASLPRKTIILGDSSGNITALDGTPATAAPEGFDGPQTSSPIPPDITANKIILAEVWVPATASVIIDDYITDRGILLSTKVRLAAVSELTISAGVIPVTQHLHTVDNEADAASDDLDTITNTNNLSWTVLRAENGARTVVVKHNTGNIWLQGAADVSLDDLEDGILLFWDSVNSKWFNIAGGGGSGDMTKAVYDSNDDGVIAAAQLDAGILYKSLFNAHTVLAATADDTPAALTVGEQTVVGRITGGNIAALTVAQLQTLLFSAALPENVGIFFDEVLSADGKYSGFCTSNFLAGATLAFGDLVYLASADSRWELVDANAEATAKGILGICVLAAAGDGSATTVLLLGKVRADTAFPALTIGAPVFAGTTAGDVQTTAPSGAADIIRIVGFGITADELLFNPSPDWFEHA